MFGTNQKDPATVLSVIVCTRNRAYAIGACLDSIAAAFANGQGVEAEIIVVDNGSTDNTATIVKSWVSANRVPVQLLFEPQPGQARSQNLALRSARGQFLAFTDDDCRLDKNFVNDLLHHYTEDKELVMRGGRIDLGDPKDLPLTINTTETRMRWSRKMNSARHGIIIGHIIGSNMTMPRALVERLGPFDEDFSPGSPIGSGADSDYVLRAYLAGATLEYVPDMAVTHWHGRKTSADGIKVLRRYLIGYGALCAKYFFREPNFSRPLYWDLKNAIKELMSGSNTFMPNINFSHQDKVACAARGALKYMFMRKDRSARRIWEDYRAQTLYASPARREIEAFEADGFLLHRRDGDEYHFIKDSTADHTP